MGVRSRSRGGASGVDIVFGYWVGWVLESIIDQRDVQRLALSHPFRFSIITWNGLIAFGQDCLRFDLVVGPIDNHLMMMLLLRAAHIRCSCCCT